METVHIYNRFDYFCLLVELLHSCIEHLFNIRNQSVRVFTGTREFVNTSIRSNQKFSKVPRNLFRFACRLIVQFRIEPQKLIDFIAVLAIHFHFIEEREINLEIGLDVLFYFGVVPRFLSHKLVGGECQYLKPSRFVLFIKFHHLQVVIRSQSTLASNIDNHYTLPVLKLTHLSHYSLVVTCFITKEVIS